MQKQRLIPVVLLIALIFFASGLTYHLPEGTIVTTLNTEPVLTGSVLGLSEVFSDPYYGERGKLMCSAVKNSDIFPRTVFRKTELEDESADEATETEVI